MSLNAVGDNDSSDHSPLIDVLEQYGYDRRLETLSSTDLPVLAEVYSHGKSQLCQILSLEAKEGSSPLFRLGDERVVDLGQIASIWKSTTEMEAIDVEKEMNKLPIQHCEHAMQQLYNTHVGKGRTSSLTKKQISNLFPNTQDWESRSYMQDVMRKVIKAGSGMMRLVDSRDAMKYLYADGKESLAVASHVLTQDGSLGGRFKRRPCMHVSTSVSANGNVTSVTFINGGWLAVDQSVRAGTEARKFAKRTDDPQTQLLTVADERIAHRLECLAMGELFAWVNSQQNDRSPEADLELDVREALKAMDLPVSPEGAAKALVRIGRWSQDTAHNKVVVQPWTETVLEAARSYRKMDQERRGRLREHVVDGETLEDRVDLTALPCVCVDAKRTSFRDDAISVRPRAQTGRKVIQEASKWEILIHIADVSDLHCPEPQKKEPSLKVLRDAAAFRGVSRYDLPLGPLHLMPPVALNALSLQTVKADETNNASAVNRCVTVWVYIDERTGKVLDAGMERSLISAPIALSYADATSLLNGKTDAPSLNRAKAILGVAERNLNLWSQYHRQRNKAARKREDRLATKELISNEQFGSELHDGGRDGFQRSRGHKIVDVALDLYGYTMSTLLRRAKAPIPRASGSGSSRGGRVGTAPLRRYIDGIAQRQALAVLCDYGGKPLTKKECIEANEVAAKATNTLSNVRSVKEKGLVSSRPRQRDALRLLKTHLSGRNGLVDAISTGRENEVVVSGVGAVAKCLGVNGTLKPGDRVMVKVQKLDAEKGSLLVRLVESDSR